MATIIVLLQDVVTRDVSYTLEAPLSLDGIHICNSY